jgi:Mrp family chromosome partitioning ATPase
MLVVMQQDKTKRKMLEPALRQLQSVESRILGFVLNKQREHGSFYRKTYYRRSAASRQRRRIHN